MSLPSQPSPQKTAWQGGIFHSLGREANEYAYYPDGLMLVDDNGTIVACGNREDVEKQHSVADYDLNVLEKRQLLMPGLVDMHVHLPQYYVTARQEDDLLQWLDKHIFSEESRFSDTQYAETVCDAFFTALLANGTTTACVFLTSHTDASNLAFERAEAIGNRVVMGLNLMDCNAPETLLRSTEDVLSDTETLYKRWHNQADGRIQYAWMPRFALTSTEKLLEGIGKLRKQYPDAYMHTHLSEQATEIDAVKAQFPWAKDYTHVYDKFGILGPRTILAHSIHLSDGEMGCIHKHQAGIAHCPSSNFFLKSGTFPWRRMVETNMLVGMGSDVGAGPELSILRSLRDAQYMQQQELIPVNTLFYTATLGAAKALHQDDRIGNLLPGKQADFIVVDLQAKSNLSPRLENQPIETILANLTYLGDDRVIDKTVVAGRTVYSKN